MKLDIMRKILNPDETEIRQPVEKDGKVVPGPALTLGECAKSALFRPVDEKVPASEKYTRGKLGDRIWQESLKAGSAASHTIDVDTEELKLLRDLIGQHYAPMIVGRVWDMLDEKDLKKTIQ